MDEEPAGQKKASDEELHQINSTNSHKMPQSGTPKSQKNIFSSHLYIQRQICP